MQAWHGGWGLARHGVEGHRHLMIKDKGTGDLRAING